MRCDLQIEAFVLAGGKSTRMGREKGLVLLKGRPMISYVLNVLKNVELPAKIVANDPAYKFFGLPVIADAISEKGPMGGLYTAFQNTKADVVFLLSCDMPLISSEGVEQFLSGANKDQILVPTVRKNINPLFGLYPVNLKDAVEGNIIADRLKMTDFILENEHIKVSSIANKMPWIFQNINDEPELKKVEKKWDHLL